MEQLFKSIIDELTGPELEAYREYVRIRRARAARQMVRRADWATTTWNGGFTLQEAIAAQGSPIRVAPPSTRLVEVPFPLCVHRLDRWEVKS